MKEMSHRRIALAFVLLNIALIFCAKSLLRPPPHELRVTFLDVGQGDAAVIETPDGKTLVMDTGRIDEQSGSDAGRRVIAPYLASRGIRRIDILLLSHPHADHIGGAASLLERFDVGLLMDNGQDAEIPLVAHYLAVAQSHHVMYRAAERGQTLTLGSGLLLRILSPTPQEREGPVNDASLILRAAYGKTTFLFTGDAEINEEADCLAAHEPLAADVLKVGHHGSVTSTTPTFLAAVHPKMAIISVGRRNLYGHPRREVIERLEASGVKTYRTDRDAAVTFVSDGVTVRAVPLHTPLVP